MPTGPAFVMKPDGIENITCKGGRHRDMIGSNDRLLALSTGFLSSLGLRHEALIRMRG